MESSRKPSRNKVRAVPLASSLRIPSPPPLRRAALTRSPTGTSPALTTQGTPDTRLSESVGLANDDDAVSTQQAPPPVERLQTLPPSEWTVDEVVARLRRYDAERIAKQAESTAALLLEAAAMSVDRRVKTGRDLFAGTPSSSVPDQQADSMKVVFKKRGKNSQKKEPIDHHMPICLKSKKDAVPPYRFHHIQIDRSIRTPPTQLNHVPYLKDVEGDEKKTYDRYRQQLEDNYTQTAIPFLNQQQKRELVHQSDMAMPLAQCLTFWVERLGMPGCDVDRLARSVSVTTRDQSWGAQDMPDGWTKHPEMFQEAFFEVFGSKRVTLRQVMRLHQQCRELLDLYDTKPATSDTAESLDMDTAFEAFVDSYSVLGCGICYAHNCEHGDFESDFSQKTLSTRLQELLPRRRETHALQCEADGKTQNHYIGHPCRHSMTKNLDDNPKPWTSGERSMLRSLYLSIAGHPNFNVNPLCLIAAHLGRSCWSVLAEYRATPRNFKPPKVLQPPLRAKNLPWYDRDKKTLRGDWKDHTTVHDFEHRVETCRCQVKDCDCPSIPCNHEGPCGKGCPCVDRGLLCEKGCRCTAESCSYKFTGCSCHAQGMNCTIKDKRCVCILLNRECDADLCDDCGVIDSACPPSLKEDDDPPPESECANCELQQRKSKAIVLGNSQLEGAGYGLYAAETIPANSLIIEYTGEVIWHDEMERRDQLRTDVFDVKPHLVFWFTLLEKEALHVDAATYGNLSRFINHASHQEANLTTKVMYVCGEFRIKFVSKRRIAVGEELYFYYSDDFHRLLMKQLKAKGVAKQRARVGQKEASNDSGTNTPASPVKPRRGRPRKYPKVTTENKGGRESTGTPVAQDAGETSNKRKRDEEEIDDEDAPRASRQRTDANDSHHDADSPTHSRASSPNIITRQRRRSAKESPTQPHGNPNGKRGGARKGSGRPRKRTSTRFGPRFAASQAMTSSQDIAEAASPEPGDGDEPEDQEDPEEESEEEDDSNESFLPAQMRVDSRRRVSRSGKFVADSEDDEMPDGNDDTVRPPPAREVIVIEDDSSSDADDQEEDNEEVQDQNGGNGDAEDDEDRQSEGENSAGEDSPRVRTHGMRRRRPPVKFPGDMDWDGARQSARMSRP